MSIGTMGTSGLPRQLDKMVDQIVWLVAGVMLLPCLKSQAALTGPESIN